MFRKIASFQYSSEAIIYKGRLESEGIAVFMRDNFTIDTDPLVSNAVGGVKLFVREEDFAAAEEILSKISKYSMTNEGGLIKCPNCGAEKVQLLTVVDDARSIFSFVLSLLFLILPFYAKYKYKCDNCNFEFKK
ncbi:DUF2007 domain-containing protein [Flavobacterium sp. UBA4197]|uniref:putative signal transducing protein n=1 Tax=Flavobacterium sp. UBA4197 TaxID=1946546 RepID=UPI00257A71A1|nr:DUF2007 domain-containing protein [Flavobacterium sp. UBA4197]